MKIRLTSISVILFVVASGWVLIAAAQRLGGYREIAKDDAGAVAAAEFAVKDQSEKKEISYKLVSLEKAESQTVAGTNYRLCLKVSHKQDEEDATEVVQVVVFRSLQQQYSLTSWAEENCAGDAQ